MQSNMYSSLDITVQVCWVEMPHNHFFQWILPISLERGYQPSGNWATLGRISSGTHIKVLHSHFSGGVPLLVLSHYWYCPTTGTVPLLVLSRYWYCPATGTVPLLVLSHYRYCPATGTVSRLVLSRYWYCPTTGTVPLLVLSHYRYCPATGLMSPLLNT